MRAKGPWALTPWIPSLELFYPWIPIPGLVPPASHRPGRTRLSPSRRIPGKVEWRQQLGRTGEGHRVFAALLLLHLLLHPSHISSASLPPAASLLHPLHSSPAASFLPGSHCPRLNPGRRILCQGEGPGGTTVPGAGSEGRGTNLPPLHQQALGSRNSTGESLLLPVAAPRGLLFSSGINPEKPNIKQSLTISLSPCFLCSEQ